ncbi:hypothetical protein CBF34_08540 [Vagococcus penaei]|uniref:SpaA-like prealbumin fold domain-containing protein n=1 Tax=Vagococcus penaei TaxID=633807 RepID=A0A1Q2D5Y1_9ENTE|nr:SpaA isopeptide-forming pilin-related protein [Vagococcus penaei]AQP53743.1 hypothetical protein BW732_05485 [Vagococcus penaei]RSU00426.1 hypothetical protein CBF34_08540 [Vagococcus penaei]
MKQRYLLTVFFGLVLFSTIVRVSMLSVVVQATVQDDLTILIDTNTSDSIDYVAYDVTQEYERLGQKGLSAMDIKDTLSQRQELPNGQHQVASQGQVVFQLPKQSGGRDAAYLFRGYERGTKQRIFQDLVMKYPLPGNVSHLQVVAKKDLPEGISFEKTVKEQQTSYALGKPIDFQLEMTLDTRTYQATTLQIIDQADTQLVLKKSSVQLLLNHQNITALCKIELTKHGFQFHVPQAILADGQNRLTVTYQMMFEGNQESNQALNTGTLLVDGVSYDAPVKVKANAYQFKKVDYREQDVGLQGAIFQVQNSDGDWLIQTSEGYAWSQQETSQVQQFISDEMGDLTVSGLKVGHYKLVEVQAPSGYVLTHEPIDFQITADTKQTTPHKIVNKAQKKRHLGLLPQLNERVTGLVSLFGLLFLGLLISHYIKKGARKK